MNQAVSRALWAGTFAGVGLCAAATLARAFGLEVAPRLAILGVLVLFVTPPLRLVVTATGFWQAGARRHAAAAFVVLLALLAAAARAALR